MRKAVAAGVVFFALVSMSGCGAEKAAALGAVQGTVVISPSCPVEMSPVAPPTGSSTPGVDNTCTGSISGATVQAFMDGSEQVAVSVSPASDGSFRCELPEGVYRFQAVPASPSVGHGVPLNVDVKAGSTVDVTLRIDTGVR
jgi:hypothetical protein